MAEEFSMAAKSSFLSLLQGEDTTTPPQNASMDMLSSANTSSPRGCIRHETMESYGVQPDVHFSEPDANLSEFISVEDDEINAETYDVCVDEDMGVDVLCSDVTFSNKAEDGILDPPTVGMLFESREAAKLYYLKYAHQQGFSIRIRNSQKRGRGCKDFNETDFVCVREGKRVLPDVIEPTQKKKRNTSTCKCDCKARMRVVLQDEEKKWRVMDFFDEHEHGLVSPDKKVLMKTVKVFPKVACVLAEKFREVNLPVGKVPSVCGAENFGFNRRGCYNHLNSKLKMYKTPEEGDATAAYEYFKKKSIEDPRFFYAVQTDNESRAVNFFWIDGRSREQYQHFGDLVLCDTTYRCNAYSMPFGPFTGLNHHRECIQFGCALLLDETEESFVWLFETWLSAMGGRSPVSLLTDRCLKHTPSNQLMDTMIY